MRHIALNQILCFFCKSNAYVTRSGKRYILGEKFEIELRISFESATLAAYDAENRTFVAPSVSVLYA